MASQVHIVFLYHPAADSRTSSLPDAIVKRVEALYQAGHSTTLVAHIRYGCLPSTARGATAGKLMDLERFLSSSSGLSLSPFITSSDYWTSSAPSSAPSMLMNVIDEIKLPRSESLQDTLDEILEPESKSKTWQGCLADGLVAALELFSRATPASIPTLARYLVHLLPDTPPLDMDDRSFPHSNLDSAHDRWSWIRAAQELGKMGVWPCTHVLPSTPGGSSSSLTPECEKVHECILDEMPSTFPSTSDSPSILGGHYTGTSNAHSLLLCGLGDAAASAARASVGASASFNSKKRSRKVSAGTKSQKDKTREGDEKGALGDTIPAGADVLGAGLGRGEIDKIAMNKIVFLQQQQQLMMRNLAIAARQQQAKEHDHEWPVRQRLLEQFRDQMLAQQAALKAQAATLHAGGSIPNLSNSLTTLMTIDKEARDRGLNLGGPSGMQQAMVQRQKQLMHLQQQQQLQQQQNKLQQTNAASSGSTGITAADVVAPGPLPISAGSPQPFWNGAIMWTVAMPNNKRNQAVTFVSAHCAPNTSKDTLMLPWQQRLNISDVQSIALSALQSYAAKNSTPCVLFQPLNVPMPNRNSGTNAAAAAAAATPAPQQTNENMYLMLAKMIDSKKSCAFISLQGANCTAQAGMVVVPTSTQVGSTNRRLLGLVFKESVPWHLFAAPSAAVQTQGSVAQPLDQQIVPVAPAATGTSGAGSTTASLSAMLASTAPPQQALFQSQQHTSNTPLAPTPFTTPQMPVWPPSSTSQLSQSAAYPQASSLQPFSVTPARPIPNVDLDLHALASQFNFHATSQGQQSQHQQQQPAAFNPAMLTNIWAMQNASDPSQQQQQQQQQQMSSSAPPAPLDLDALQRLLGLSTS